ncbi:MAG: hypothetical protein LBU98_01240 [Alistipes sp.]|jgi:hypothetical protein|nr:hypothetical protein [Alistipes sp.]
MMKTCRETAVPTRAGAEGAGRGSVAAGAWRAPSADDAISEGKKMVSSTGETSSEGKNVVSSTGDASSEGKKMVSSTGDAPSEGKNMVSSTGETSSEGKNMVSSADGAPRRPVAPTANDHEITKANKMTANKINLTMKKLFGPAAILTVAAIALTACWPAQIYDMNGISFRYPGGWKVSVDEFADSRGYLQLEKEGAAPAASIVFGWMESEAAIAADMMLDGIFKQMTIDEGLTDVALEPATDSNYGDYPARAVTYTATVDGTAVAGAVWVFSAEGRVVNVAVREGADKANVAAFKKIKDSFELK